MERQRQKGFVKNCDDSPSSDITGDFITPDYKNPNLYNHRRTSSSESVDSGISSTGSSHNSSIATTSSPQNVKTKTETNPFSSSQVRKEVKDYL